MENNADMSESLERIIKETDRLAEKILSLDGELDTLRNKANDVARGTSLAVDTIDGGKVGSEGMPEANLQSLDMIANTQGIIDSLVSQAHLGRQAEDGMDQIKLTMAELDRMMAMAATKAESISELQLVLEEAMSKNKALELSQAKLGSIEGYALSLEKKALRLETESEALRQAMERHTITSDRLGKHLESAGETVRKLENAHREMESATIEGRAAGQTEERLLKLIPKMEETESRLTGLMAGAEGIAAEFERFFQMKRRADRTLEQVTEKARRAEETLEANREAERKSRLITGRMNEMENRFETLAVKALDITGFEETYNSVHRKLEVATAGIEELEERMKAAERLEEKLGTLAKTVENMRGGIEALEKETGSAGKIMEAVRLAEARFGELIEKTESAGDRLATITSLERTLSSLEDKTFGIIKKLEDIEEKGKIVFTAQQKIDQLQKLLDQAEGIMKKIVSG